MKRNYLLLIAIITVFLMLMGIGITFCQEQLPSAKQSAVPQELEFVGKIVDIDLQKNVIIAKEWSEERLGQPEGKAMSFTLATNEYVVGRGETRSIKQLERGDVLVVSYTTDKDGNNLATFIRLFGKQHGTMVMLSKGNMADLTSKDKKFINALESGKIQKHFFNSCQGRGMPSKVNNGRLEFTLNKLDYQLEDRMTSAELVITFWKSEEGYYFYRIQGGCEAYENTLYGPYRLEKDKFIAVESK